MQNFLQPNTDLQNASNLIGKKIPTINKKCHAVVKGRLQMLRLEGNFILVAVWEEMCAEKH